MLYAATKATLKKTFTSDVVVDDLATNLKVIVSHDNVNSPSSLTFNFPLGLDRSCVCRIEN